MVKEASARLPESLVYLAADDPTPHDELPDAVAVTCLYPGSHAEQLVMWDLGFLRRYEDPTVTPCVTNALFSEDAAWTGGANSPTISAAAVRDMFWRRAPLLAKQRGIAPDALRSEMIQRLWQWANVHPEGWLVVVEDLWRDAVAPHDDENIQLIELGTKQASPRWQAKLTTALGMHAGHGARAGPNGGSAAATFLSLGATIEAREMWKQINQQR